VGGSVEPHFLHATHVGVDERHEYASFDLALRGHSCAQALASNSAVALGEGAVEAGVVLVVYLKGCLHLFLAGQALAKGHPGGLPLAGVTR
jgi:hypothetical protein